MRRPGFTSSPGFGFVLIGAKAVGLVVTFAAIAAAGWVVAIEQALKPGSP